VDDDCELNVALDSFKELQTKENAMSRELVQKHRSATNAEKATAIAHSSAEILADPSHRAKVYAGAFIQIASKESKRNDKWY
jgi:hypothetical protein